MTTWFLVPGICFSPQKKKQFDTVEQKNLLYNCQTSRSMTMEIVVDQSTDVAGIEQLINFTLIAETPALELVKHFHFIKSFSWTAYQCKSHSSQSITQQGGST